MTAEIFRCEPLRASLSRVSCGARHREVTTAGDRRGIKLISSACADCAVGRAHAAGEQPAKWPDGSPIVLLTLARSTEPASLPRVEPPRPSKVYCAPRARKRADVALRMPRAVTPPPAAPEPETTAASAAEEATVSVINPVEIEYLGRTQIIAAWAAELNVTPNCVRQRHYRGLNPDGTGTPTAKKASKKASKRKAAKAKPARRAPVVVAREREPDAEYRGARAGEVLRLLELTGIEHEVVTRSPRGMTFFVPA